MMQLLAWVCVAHQSSRHGMVWWRQCDLQQAYHLELWFKSNREKEEEEEMEEDEEEEHVSVTKQPQVRRRARLTSKHAS